MRCNGTGIFDRFVVTAGHFYEKLEKLYNNNEDLINQIQLYL